MYETLWGAVYLLSACKPEFRGYIPAEVLFDKSKGQDQEAKFWNKGRQKIFVPSKKKKRQSENDESKERTTHHTHYVQLDTSSRKQDLRSLNCIQYSTFGRRWALRQEIENRDIAYGGWHTRGKHGGNRNREGRDSEQKGREQGGNRQGHKGRRGGGSRTEGNRDKG